jgi:hypothetical protein
MQLQDEVNSESQTLHQRDFYTVGLADFLDGDSEGFSEENRLKAELESQIHEHELELKAKVTVQNPDVASALMKKWAYYKIENEHQAKELQNVLEETAASAQPFDSSSSS